MPEHVNFVSIYSRADAICPYPCCKMELKDRANYKNIELKEITHSQFVTSRRVYEVIRRELEMGMHLPITTAEEDHEKAPEDQEDRTPTMIN